MPSCPRILSLGADVADPHGLLPGSVGEPFHMYVKLGAGEAIHASVGGRVPLVLWL